MTASRNYRPDELVAHDENLVTSIRERLSVVAPHAVTFKSMRSGVKEANAQGDRLESIVLGTEPISTFIENIKIREPDFIKRKESFLLGVQNFDIQTSRRIEELTRDNVGEWQRQHNGRVTGRNVRQIVTKVETLKKKNDTDMESICKSVTHAGNDSLNTEAIKYGIESEKRAIDGFINEHFADEDRPIIRKCGLVIDPEMPYLGTTPDSILQFRNTDALIPLEVKSNFKFRNKNIHDTGLWKELGYLICSEHAGRNWRKICKCHSSAAKLNPVHPYYSQIILEISLNDAEFGYFSIYNGPNETGLHLKVEKDDAMVGRIKKAVEYFYLHYYLDYKFRETST